MSAPLDPNVCPVHLESPGLGAGIHATIGAGVPWCVYCGALRTVAGWRFPAIVEMMPPELLARLAELEPLSRAQRAEAHRERVALAQGARLSPEILDVLKGGDE